MVSYKISKRNVDLLKPSVVTTGLVLSHPLPRAALGPAKSCAAVVVRSEGRVSPVSLHPTPQQLYCDKAVIKSCCECCGGDQCNDPASLQGQALNVHSPVKYRGSKGEYRQVNSLQLSAFPLRRLSLGAENEVLGSRILIAVTDYCWC